MALHRGFRRFFSLLYKAITVDHYYTADPTMVFHPLFDYQSERHCSKTQPSETSAASQFDYQPERHCSKTTLKWYEAMRSFDYQSERHCSKTHSSPSTYFSRLITSQNDTAPKLLVACAVKATSLITSQNDTAPKQRGGDGFGSTV